MHSIIQPVWREVLEGSAAMKGHALCELIFATLNLSLDELELF